VYNIITGISDFVHRPVFYACLTNVTNTVKDKKFWEELIVNFPLIRHAPRTKKTVQEFFYRRVCIRCHGNVFTELLSSSDRGDTHVGTQTDGRDL
jgi:hypothetical protein